MAESQSNAESGESTAKAEETSKTTETKTETKTEKTFSQSELDQIINERLKRERESYEKKEAERIETERIEKLSGEEKIKAQHKAEMDKLLAERDEAIKSVRISDAGKQLAVLGYDSEFASMMVGKDDAETKVNIERFDKMVKKLVEKQVQGNLAHGTPSAPSGGDNGKKSLRDLVRQSAGLR